MRPSTPTSAARRRTLPTLAALAGPTLAALALIGLALIASACRSAGPTAPDWVDDVCLKHEDCASDELCVHAECVPASPDVAVDLSGVLASQWFDHEDGVCAYDHECGPWVCFNNTCSSPADANRRMLPAENYRYWDTSCVGATDCGPWLCADGWCTQPGFVSQDAQLAEVTPPGLDGCLADHECEQAGADCVFPGYCYPDAADEPMTFVELGALTWYNDPDGACNADADCGPHACVDNWCVAQDLTDRPRPARSNFEYYDASCSDDSSCGEWICQDGFCQDPDFATILGFYGVGSGGALNAVDSGEVELLFGVEGAGATVDWGALDGAILDDSDVLETLGVDAMEDGAGGGTSPEAP